MTATTNRIVKVTWIDAHSISEWTDVVDLEEPELVHTVGFLTKETDKSYFISGSINNTTTEVGDTIAIPKAWVKSIIDIKEPKTKKK